MKCLAVHVIKGLKIKLLDTIYLYLYWTYETVFEQADKINQVKWSDALMHLPWIDA